jgi:protein CpxP
MKKNLIRLGSVAALAAGMAFAQAQAPAAQPPAQPATPAKPGAVHRTFRQRSRQRMMQALNLTPAQREQVRSIFQQARQSAQPFTQQLRQNREAMALAVKANDNARIQQLATQRGHLEGQVMAIRSQAAAKFYTTLTPEQRAKSDQLHQRHEGRMQQRTGQRTNG